MLSQLTLPYRRFKTRFRYPKIFSKQASQRLRQLKNPGNLDYNTGGLFQRNKNPSYEIQPFDFYTNTPGTDQTEIKAEINDTSNKPSEYSLEIPILDFIDPNIYTVLNLQSDQSHGGSSQGVCQFDPDTRSMLFEGEIIYEDIETMEFSPGLKAEFKFQSSFDFFDFDGIRIKYFTDGEHHLEVMLNLGLTSACQYIKGTLKNDKEGWGTFDLPFDHFQIHAGTVAMDAEQNDSRTLYGSLEDQGMISCSEIYFGVQTDVKGKFKFMIGEFSLYADERANIVDTYFDPKPVFYKKPENYGLMTFSEYDTGEMM